MSRRAAELQGDPFDRWFSCIELGVGFQLNKRPGYMSNVAVGSVSHGLNPELPFPEMLRIQLLENVLRPVHHPVIQGVFWLAVMERKGRVIGDDDGIHVVPRVIE